MAAPTARYTVLRLCLLGQEMQKGKVQGSGIQGLGFRVQGLGFRGLGLRLMGRSLGFRLGVYDAPVGCLKLTLKTPEP